MPSFSTSISRFFARYESAALILVITTIFMVFSVYSYIWFFVPFMRSRTTDDISNNPSEPAGGGPSQANTTVVYFFHVDWCKYCVDAQPEWDSFSESMHGKTINGKVINCVDVNMTDTTNDSGADVAIRTKYNVKSFPEVQLVKPNGDVVVLDAAPTHDSLTQFVNKMA